MSPSSSPVRRRRPRRPPRGRNRPPQRVAISTVVRSVLVVTAVSSIAIGTYFAFTNGVLTRLIGRQQNTYEDHIFELRAQIDRQYSDQKQVEQQLTALLQRQETLEQRTPALTSDLSATAQSSRSASLRPRQSLPKSRRPRRRSMIQRSSLAPNARRACSRPNCRRVRQRSITEYIAPPITAHCFDTVSLRPRQRLAH